MPSPRKQEQAVNRGHHRGKEALPHCNAYDYFTPVLPSVDSGSRVTRSPMALPVREDTCSQEGWPGHA
jgi:hypothetical protein